MLEKCPLNSGGCRGAWGHGSDPAVIFLRVFAFCIGLLRAVPCHASPPLPPLLVPDEQLGYTATYIIGTLSLPGFIFLFYAAIKKGQAEVEEDDAKFGKGRW